MKKKKTNEYLDMIIAANTDFKKDYGSDTDAIIVSSLSVWNKVKKFVTPYIVGVSTPDIDSHFAGKLMGRPVFVHKSIPKGLVYFVPRSDFNEVVISRSAPSGIA